MAMKAQDFIESQIMTALTKGEIAAAVNLIVNSVDISALSSADQLVLKVRLVRAFMFAQELRKSGEINLNGEVEISWETSGLQNNWLVSSLKTTKETRSRSERLPKGIRHM